MTEPAVKNRRRLQGVVTSTRATKTITVEVERRFKHAKYGKFVKKRKRYMAHDEDESARDGDVVAIVESRPLSKRKRWTLAEVVTRTEDPDAGRATAGGTVADATAEVVEGDAS